jgi:RNA polymerase sigma-70 factor (ECF subfamily)
MVDDPTELEAVTETPSAEIVAALVEGHREFLKFVERRVGSRALAEDILQNAFVRCVEKFDTVRESATGWFYRVLRNAITDHYRRAGASERGLESFAAEPVTSETSDEDLHRAVCKCVATLAETLKPEYAAALRRIEVDGLSVKEYADETGISSSNAGVRVFRAREALRKQVARSCGTCASHGCLDCTCGEPAARGEHAHSPTS